MAYPLIERFGLSSAYGPREGLYGTHLGVDMPTPIGIDVPEWRGGVVAFAGNLTFTVGNKKYTSITLIVNHDDNTFTVYDHLSAILVKKGQRVVNGQVIARTGNSGYVLPEPTPASPNSGAHLHLQWARGKYTGGIINDYPTMNPEPELRAWSLSGSGGTTTGGQEEMTFEQYAGHILDVIEDDPHYQETKQSAFEGHVAWLKIETPNDWAAPRKWAKDIMKNNGVLNRTHMAQHVTDDEIALAALRDENTTDRIAWNRSKDDLEQRLATADEVTQTVAADFDEYKQAHRGTQAELETANAAVKELTSKLEETVKQTRPVEGYTAWELIARGIERLFGGKKS